MVAKTPKTKKSKKLRDDEKAGIIDKAKRACAALEKNIAIYENDLKRSEEALKNQFGVDDVEMALEKVEELNSKLPELQEERDGLIVEIKEYLSKHNL